MVSQLRVPTKSTINYLEILIDLHGHGEAKCQPRAYRGHLHTIASQLDDILVHQRSLLLPAADAADTCILLFRVDLVRLILLLKQHGKWKKTRQARAFTEHAGHREALNQQVL